jgi:hypothetical protein
VSKSHARKAACALLVVIQVLIRTSGTAYAADSAKTGQQPLSIQFPLLFDSFSTIGFGLSGGRHLLQTGDDLDGVGFDVKPDVVAALGGDYDPSEHGNFTISGSRYFDSTAKDWLDRQEREYVHRVGLDVSLQSARTLDARHKWKVNNISASISTDLAVPGSMVDVFRASRGGSAVGLTAIHIILAGAVVNQVTPKDSTFARLTVDGFWGLPVFRYGGQGDVVYFYPRATIALEPHALRQTEYSLELAVRNEKLQSLLKAADPNIFVRYHEGRTAPQFAYSRGVHFGIKFHP